MENLYIGIDVGGMSFKGALISKTGEIVHRVNIKTDSKGDPKKFIVDIKKVVEGLLSWAKENRYEVLGIGLGIPGICNTKTGVIDYAPNLNIEFVPIVEALQEYKLKVAISNDANVACLGEAKFGAAKAYENVILLTLGTGVGGGVVIDGKLFEGFEGKGCELGHMTIVVNGVMCGCGNKGCFESYASASGLIRETKEEMMKNKDSLMWTYVGNDINNVNGLTSFDCAKKGDESAIKVVNQYVEYLSIGILNFCNIFRPEVILLGGGISNQGDYLIEKVEKYCKERNYGFKNSPKVEIKCATLKNDAGVIGAACLVM